MAEKSYEVRTFGVDYICDYCCIGAMENTGIMLMTDPPKWRHKCVRCGEIADMFDKYPTVRFERITAQ